MKRRSPNRQRTLRPIVVSLLLASVTNANAQADMVDLPLEQLMQMQVTTASRYAQTALEAPATVSVVTAEDIRLFGHRSLADVLASMRGLYVSYDRAYHYLGTRGFATPGDYNTRVLLLVNGVRFNDNIYDQASIGTDFPIDLDLIDRVEFVSGPGSAVYGANAFFGVINVITRDGHQLAGPQVAVEAGNHASTKARLSVGTVDAYGGDWLVAATRTTSRGADLYFPAYDAPESNGGMAQRLDYDRSTQLFARMRREGLALTLAHGERHKGVPTAAFSQVFNDPRSKFIDQSTRLVAEYAAQVSPTLAFTGRAHAGRYQYVGDYVYDYPPLTLNRDVGTGQWWGADLQWMSTALARHKLVWGLDYRRDTRITQTNADLEPAVEYLNAHRKGDVAGIYVQDEFALRPNLTLHTGLRWGKQTGSSGTLSPRLGLVYWWDPSTAIKLLHGTAYRPPNAYERDYRVDLPGGVVDSPHVRSERVRTTELTLERAPIGAMRYLLTAFHSEVRDLISLTAAGSTDRFVLDNTRSVKVHGVEAELEQRWQASQRLRLVYGWQKARDSSLDGTLSNSPRHLLKVQWSDAVSASPTSAWGRGRYAIEAIGVGPRNTSLGTRLPGRILTHVNYSTRISQMDVSLGVYNLFNQHYSDPTSLEIRETALRQDGRTFRVKLTYTF